MISSSYGRISKTLELDESTPTLTAVGGNTGYITSNQSSTHRNLTISSSAKCIFIEFNPDSRAGNLMFQYATAIGACQKLFGEVSNCAVSLHPGYVEADIGKKI